MPRLKIGAVLDSLGLPLRKALELAPTLGVSGVQLDAVGDIAPDALSHTGRRDFQHLLRSRNLELTALNCPLRHGFSVLENLEGRVAHVRKVMSLAYDLGPRMVIVFPGPIPKEENQPDWPVMFDSLLALGRHGERIGTTLALASGLEPPATLAAYLRRVGTGGLGVNLDPASLLMRGFDPYSAVREFQTLIVHTYARDAIPNRPDRAAVEVPVGQGDIDWTAYLGALEEVEYRGWLTLKRGPSVDPARDIQQGATFLKRLVG